MAYLMATDQIRDLSRNARYQYSIYLELKNLKKLSFKKSI